MQTPTARRRSATFCGRRFVWQAVFFRYSTRTRAPCSYPTEEGASCKTRCETPLRSTGRRIRSCIDEAKGYCVSVYRYQLERLESLGAVTSLFDGGILLLSDGFYNEHTGFSLEAGTRDFQEV